MDPTQKGLLQPKHVAEGTRNERLGTGQGRTVRTDRLDGSADFLMLGPKHTGGP
jgi:hypothetical protein